jgi:hypothetical protein
MQPDMTEHRHSLLLDEPIRLEQQRLGNRQPERLRRLQVSVVRPAPLRVDQFDIDLCGEAPSRTSLVWRRLLMISSAGNRRSSGPDLAGTR